MKISRAGNAPADMQRQPILRFAAGILLLSPIILVTGCATPAETLDKSAVQQVQTGQDRTVVRKLLGEPNRSRNGANGETADIYVYDEVVNSASSASSAARDLKIRTFSVRYDSVGQVEDTLLYESRTPALVFRLTAFAGPSITSVDSAKIRTGVTTRDELERMFQKPQIVNLHPVRGLELHWYHVEVGTSAVHFEDESGLHVLVDDKGIVRTVELSNTADRQR